MLFVPLPFVVTILLLILFFMVLRRDGTQQPNLPFLALILVGAVNTFLAGLRWGYGVNFIGVLSPILAGLVPPLAYCGVQGVLGRSRRRPAQVALHCLPSALIAVLMVVDPQLIDLALIAIFAGYALAILFMMRAGADALALTPFNSVDLAYRAIVFTALALLLSALLDLAVYLDLTLLVGEHALLIVQTGNLVALILLGIAAAGLGPNPAYSDTSQSPADADMGAVPVGTLEDNTKEYAETIRAVEALLMMRRIYRDVDLNLDRLARRLSIPARQLSVAINQSKGRNVSQYINEFRVAEACELLSKSDKSVTEIMFDVGFQTKSNFNREFRRVTDMTPIQWRNTRGQTD